MVAPAAASPAEAGQLDAVVTMIAGQQRRADRLVAYVGTEPEGIRAELDGLEPPWAETARVVGDEAGAVVAAVVVEWDEDLGRAWILGPWVDGDDDVWAVHAAGLLDAAVAQLPHAVTELEMAGDVANTRLRELAARRGWVPSMANHALLADAATTATWPTPDDEDDEDDERAGDLRPAVASDVAAIAPLHDAEFPGTYASAERLVAGQADGSRLVLVAPAPDGDGIVGYAAGQIHDDGEGFIDFVAIDPRRRGAGAGRRLVMAMTRQLLDRSTNGRVCLTVQDQRLPARALYESLGFRPDGTFVAYRSWTAT